MSRLRGSPTRRTSCRCGRRHPPGPPHRAGRRAGSATRRPPRRPSLPLPKITRLLRGSFRARSLGRPLPAPSVRRRGRRRRALSRCHERQRRTDCMNRVKTAMLLATLTALLLWAGQALAGQGGLMMALVFAGLMNFGAYWWSDKIILRLYGAQPITEAQAPDLYGIVRDLARRGNLPMPAVYRLPQEAPNAFATGRDPNHAAVAVTDGLVQLLDREELAGVIAHELGHVKN